MEISTLVTIISYCFLVITLMTGFLIGFWRGVKRSVISFCTTAIVFALSFFLAPVITSAILKISVPINGSNMQISQILIEQIKGMAGVEDLTTASPTLLKFLEIAPSFLVNLIVFYLALSVFGILGYLIKKIIIACCLKSAKKEKVLELKRNRWAGGAIGIASSFVFMVLTYAPINSIAGMVTEVQEIKPYYSSSGTSNALIEVPQDVNDGLASFNKTALGFSLKCFGLDDAMFDSLTSFNINDENVQLRKDAFIALKFASTATELQKDFGASGKSLTNINWNELEKDFNTLVQDGLFTGVFSDVAKEIILNYEKVDMLNENADVVKILNSLKENLKNNDAGEYFTQDLKEVFQIASSFAKKGVLDEFIFESTKTTQEKLIDIATIENEQLIKDNISSLLNLNLLQDSIQPVCEIALDGILSGTEFVVGNFKDSKWAEGLEDIVNSGFNIIKSVDIDKILEIKDDYYKVLTLDENQIGTLFSNLGSVMDNLNKLPISTTENDTIIPLVDSLLNKANIKISKNIFDDATGTEKAAANYEVLLNEASSIVKEVIKLDLYENVKNGINTTDLITEITTKINDNTLSNIILPLIEIEALRTNVFDEYILPALDGIDLINIEDLTIKTAGKIDVEQTHSNWKNELTQLTKVLKTLSKEREDNKPSILSEILNKNPDALAIVRDLTDAELDEMLKPLLYAKSTKPIIEKVLSTMDKELEKLIDNDPFTNNITLSLDNITLKEGNVEDQAQEIVDVLKSILNILPSDDTALSFENIPYDKLGVMLDALKNNGYRDKLSPDENKLTEEGLFKSTFDALIDVVVDKYEQITQIKGTKEWYELSFTETLELVQDFKDIAEIPVDEVTGEINEGAVVEKVEEIFNNMTDEKEEQLNNIIDMVDKNTTSKVEIPEEQKQDVENILDAIKDENYDGGTIIGADGNPITDADGNEITVPKDLTLDDETIKNIKDFLGIDVTITIESTTYAVIETVVMDNKVVTLSTLEETPTIINASNGTGAVGGTFTLESVEYVIGNTAPDGSGFLTLSNGTTTYTAK